MKVALVHEHLAQDGGAEKVLKVFQDIFPDAPTYTLVYNPATANTAFAGKTIIPSFIQSLPGGVRQYRWYLPLMPSAIERFDLQKYDLVLSSASGFAKGVITRPDAVHISYCHSHTRYLWSDTHEYVENLPYPKFFKRGIIAPYLTYLRLWDRLAADRVDYFIANSASIQTGIRKYYRRESTVIHPPVAIQKFSIAPNIGNYYLTGGRLVAYKRFDLVVQACSRLGVPLKVFGVGPEEKKLRSLAKGKVEFLGRVPDTDLPRLYNQAIAFINPQIEDFGITVVESMASGRPVIAFQKGGALETVIPGKTGVFFDEQEWEALADTLLRFRPRDYDPAAIRAWAEQFGEERFRQNIRAFVESHSTPPAVAVQYPKPS